MKIAIMNGPNLSRLGERSPDIYGAATWEDLQTALEKEFPRVELQFFQSNHEGALIDQLERWHDDGVAHLVINPGALTHQSYALRDAIEGLGLHAVEVHISNVHRRERFRRHSVTAPVMIGQVVGLGVDGYRLAVDFLVRMASPPQV